MLIPDRLEIGLSKKVVCGGHFWGEIPNISHKNQDDRVTAVSWVNVWPIWGFDGVPDG